MADLVFTNNASSLLAVSILAAGTSVQVAAGEGALFPSPSGGDFFKLVLHDASGNIEVCHCTSRATDLMTVTRAQEGTTARDFTNGVTRVELRVTKGTLERFQQVGGDTPLPIADGGTAANTAAGARTSLGAAAASHTHGIGDLTGVAATSHTHAAATDITGQLGVANGGTGASTAAGARSNLGVTATGADTTYNARASNLSDVASAASARTNLGLGSIATKNVTVSTSDPSGTPADGDLWLKYTP